MNQVVFQSSPFLDGQLATGDIGMNDVTGSAYYSPNGSSTYGFPFRCYSRTSNVQILNTTTWTDVATVTVPAGLLLSLRILHIHAPIRYTNQNGTTENLNVRCQISGSDEWDAVSSGGFGSSTTARTGHVHAVIMAISASAIEGYCEVSLGHSTGTITTGQGTFSTVFKYGVGVISESEDLTAALGIRIAFSHATADPDIYLNSPAAIAYVI